VGLEDAADHNAIGKHIEIILIPLTGGAATRCTLEDQVRYRHSLPSDSTSDAYRLVEDLFHCGRAFTSSLHVFEN
jgi:hypothetical protein